ncbi:MAG: long-chain fatty acid--CoA ligase [Crenarchaeota archaeon]|nr:long-chain fatty acid--CoA ligase [Thermoproteota archaeon]
MSNTTPFDFGNPPWVKSYDPGVPARVEVPDIMLHEMLIETVRKHGDKPAVTFYGETLSYRQLLDHTMRVAAGLKKEGVNEDGCVAILLANTIQFITVSYAAMMIGARACLLNPLWSMVQVDDTLHWIKADLVVVQDALLDRLGGVLDKWPAIVSSLDEYGSLSWKTKVRIGRLMGKLPKPPRKAKRYRDLLKMGKIGEAEIYRGDPSDKVAALLFTGGTTGKPKAVMLTHKNIISNILYQKIWFHREEGKDRVLGLLPFFHAYGFGSILGLTLMLGAHMILQVRYDPREFLELIAKYRITLVPAAPTIYLNLLKVFTREQLEKIRDIPEICFSGAAPLPVEVMKKWEEITECPIVEGYGLTETSPVVAANPVKGKKKPGSIGLPMPNTLVAIADPVEPKLIDGTGELVVSGLQVMKGYYNMPDENRRAFFECCGYKWFRTGDIGYMDEEGYFYIVDRKKDVIKYKGHSVFPRTIEEVLYKHPCIAEAAVIGVPDPEVGENIKAFIVLRDECKGMVSEEDIKAWAKERLGLHEYPRLIEFREELPKSRVGKILRRVLREEELRKLGKT